MIFVPKLIKHGIAWKIQRSINAWCGGVRPHVTDNLNDEYDGELMGKLPHEGFKPGAEGDTAQAVLLPLMHSPAEAEHGGRSRGRVRGSIGSPWHGKSWTRSGTPPGAKRRRGQERIYRVGPRGPSRRQGQGWKLALLQCRWGRVGGCPRWGWAGPRRIVSVLGALRNLTSVHLSTSHCRISPVILSATNTVKKLFMWKVSFPQTHGVFHWNTIKQSLTDVWSQGTFAIFCVLNSLAS